MCDKFDSQRCLVGERLFPDVLTDLQIQKGWSVQDDFFHIGIFTQCFDWMNCEEIPSPLHAARQGSGESKYHHVCSRLLAVYIIFQWIFDPRDKPIKKIFKMMIDCVSLLIDRCFLGLF